MGNFFDLYGKRVIEVLKSIPEFLWFDLVISLLLAFLVWFVLDVLVGLAIGLFFLWKWIFFVFLIIAFFFDFLVSGIIVSVTGLRLMKKFETTSEIIYKAVSEYHLLAKENKKIYEGTKEEFEKWYSSQEFRFSDDMAESILKSIIRG